MNPILKQLYEGEINPAEFFKPQSQEYRDLHAEFFKNADTLREKLAAISPDWRDTFDCLFGDYACLSSMALEEMFYYAFRLGAGLVMACI